jgi:hypothetical protein
MRNTVRSLGYQAEVDRGLVPELQARQTHLGRMEAGRRGGDADEVGVVQEEREDKGARAVGLDGARSARRGVRDRCTRDARIDAAIRVVDATVHRFGAEVAGALRRLGGRRRGRVRAGGSTRSRRDGDRGRDRPGEGDGRHGSQRRRDPAGDDDPSDHPADALRRRVVTRFHHKARW